MKRIYFAGPLFCAAEQDYNLKITSVLESAGYSVFLPQRDGFNAAMLSGKSEEEKSAMIFEKDTGEIKKCDIFFMILDGRVPDEGACAELGMAYAMGKPCYGLKTDVRAMEKDLEINPLIKECFIKTITAFSTEEAIKKLKNFLENNEL